MTIDIKASEELTNRFADGFVIIDEEDEVELGHREYGTDSGWRVQIGPYAMQTLYRNGLPVEICGWTFSPGYALLHSDHCAVHCKVPVIKATPARTPEVWVKLLNFDADHIWYESTFGWVPTEQV